MTFAAVRAMTSWMAGPGPICFYGGAGIDTVRYARSDAGVRLDLANDGTSAPATGGHAEGDILHGIENLAGSRFADVLIGNDGANRFTGGAGADIFGIDLVASHITEADAIMDFSGRATDDVTVRDDAEQIQFSPYDTLKKSDQLNNDGTKLWLYYLAADRTADGNTDRNDYVVYNHDRDGTDGVLFIMRGESPGNINLYWDDINISRIRGLGEAMIPDIIELF